MPNLATDFSGVESVAGVEILETRKPLPGVAINEEPKQLVEHFFRHESAALVSVLTRVFGFGRLHLVEEMVQSALVEALRHWSSGGIPNDPSAWIYRVAKNRMLDQLRREKVHRSVLDDLQDRVAPNASGQLDHLFFDGEIQDSLLQMMFACCHPALEPQAQSALTLKILCGFSYQEIGRALLISADAANKRVNRARKHLASSDVALEMPSPREVSSRLGSVHQVLYLLFNEGYSPSTGDLAIRDDLCEEAARLCHMLCQHPRTATEASMALLALMLFHGARLESRVEPSGAVVLLRDQDRGKWDQALIDQAEFWLAKSAEGESISTFHLEAGIAMHHCRAPSFSQTNWQAIIRLYDRLIECHWTPVYVLNRAIALGQAGRIDEAFEQLRSIAEHPNMRRYFLLDCAVAHLHLLENDTELAQIHLERALQEAESEHDRTLIAQKLNSCRRP